MKSSELQSNYRDYHHFFVATLFSSIGVWMQRFSIDWFVLDLTESATSLGIVTFLQFFPIFVFSILGGRLADSWNNTKLLVLTSTLFASVSLLTGYLMYRNLLTLQSLMVLTFLGGFATGLEGPLRLVYISKLVGSHNLAGGIGFNSMNFNIGRVSGPLIAGFVTTTFGVHWVFYAVSVLFFVTGSTIWFFRPRIAHVAKIPSQTAIMANVKRKFFIRPEKDSVIILCHVFLVTFFCMHFPTTIAFMARFAFNLGVNGFAILSSAIAFGFFLGGWIVTRKRIRQSLESLSLLTIYFASALFLTSIAPSPNLFGIGLFIVGVLGATMVGSFNLFIQENCNPRFRGRIIALYLSVYTAGTTFGVLLVGLIAQTFGARAPLILGAATSLISSVVILKYKNFFRSRLRN